MIPMTVTSYKLYVAPPFPFTGITSVPIKPLFLLGCQVSVELSALNPVLGIQWKPPSILFFWSL